MQRVSIVKDSFGLAQKEVGEAWGGGFYISLAPDFVITTVIDFRVC